MHKATKRKNAMGRSAPKRKRSVAVGLWWGLPAGIFLFLFFIFPLINNLFSSLRFGQDGGVFSDYQRLLTDAYYLKVIFRTLTLSLIVTFLCVLIGFPVARILVRSSGKWAAIIIFLLTAPLLTSVIMRTFGWQVLFAPRGIVNASLVSLGMIDHPVRILQSPISVIIGLVHVNVPFMVLSIASALRDIDPRLEESARILGANRLSTLFRITLPLSLDGIGTGCILVFMLVNGSFVTMLLLGGGSVVTLPLLIYQQFIQLNDSRFAIAMGNVLLVFALICLWVQSRFIRRKGLEA